MLMRNTTQRRVRGAVDVTRKALNRALDAAEPRLESAALQIEDLGRDGLRAMRKRSKHGLSALESGYGQLQRNVRRRLAPRKRRADKTKLALVAAGLAAITFGLLRK